MCSCSLPISNSNSLQAGVAGIPLKGIMDDNFASLLSLAWCMNETKVKDAFRPIGLDISDDDLIVLIQAHQSGSDLKAYKVSFKDIIKAIKFTEAEKNKPSCPFSLTV